MIPKFLFGASLACSLLVVSIRARPIPQEAQSNQQNDQSMSVTGKVTKVETGGKSFSVEVTQSGKPQTMQFVVDKGTTVQGHVGAGSVATVEYQPGSNGQFVAVTVTEKNA